MEVVEAGGFPNRCAVVNGKSVVNSVRDKYDHWLALSLSASLLDLKLCPLMLGIAYAIVF